MEENYRAKQHLREDMALRKKGYSTNTLSEFSLLVLERLEQFPLFRASMRLAIYYALPGEVQTDSFIERWIGKKEILLPAVQGNYLQLKLYTGKDSLKKGMFGIFEPEEPASIPEIQPDLIIVPGVAFDRQLNRLGRGKGFYDRLLSSGSIPKIGLCFDFQLIEHIPTEPTDIRMDYIITNKETI